MAFYNNLRDDVHPVIPVARCVVAAPSVILLFDEVKPFKGVRRVGDQLKGCSREEASLVVRHLAALHAKFWKSPVLNEGCVAPMCVCVCVWLWLWLCVWLWLCGCVLALNLSR